MRKRERELERERGFSVVNLVYRLSLSNLSAIALAAHYRAERNRRILDSSKEERIAGSDCAMSTSNINFAGCTQYLHLITAVCANAISFSLSFSSFSPGHLSFPAPFSVTAALVTSFSFSSRPVRSLCVRLLLLEENLMLPRLHNAKSVRRLRSARESLFCIRDSERFW